MRVKYAQFVAGPQLGVVRGKGQLKLTEYIETHGLKMAGVV